MLVFISGPSGSGKSLYAEQRVLDLSRNYNISERVYLATSRIYDDDPEMISRVMRHRLMRSGKGFITIEKRRSVRRSASRSPTDRADRSGG